MLIATLLIANMAIIPRQLSSNVGDIDISKTLQGRHWIDGVPEDLSILDKGMRSLLEHDPSVLEEPIKKYLRFYEDAEGVLYVLKSQEVIYRRNIDIAVLNRAMVDSIVPINPDNKYGVCPALEEPAWLHKPSGVQLLLNKVAMDISTAPSYDAWSEFTIVQRWRRGNPRWRPNLSVGIS